MCVVDSNINCLSCLYRIWQCIPSWNFKHWLISNGHLEILTVSPFISCHIDAFLWHIYRTKLQLHRRLFTKLINQLGIRYFHTVLNLTPQTFFQMHKKCPIFNFFNINSRYNVWGYHSKFWHYILSNLRFDAISLIGNSNCHAYEESPKNFESEFVFLCHHLYHIKFEVCCYIIHRNFKLACIWGLT